MERLGIAECRREAGLAVRREYRDGIVLLADLAVRIWKVTLSDDCDD